MMIRQERAFEVFVTYIQGKSVWKYFDTSADILPFITREMTFSDLLFCSAYHIMKTLRKHAYSNILKIFPQKKKKKKKWRFLGKKNSDIFHISAQNIDCGYSCNMGTQNIDCGYSSRRF